MSFVTVFIQYVFKNIIHSRDGLHINLAFMIAWINCSDMRVLVFIFRKNIY